MKTANWTTALLACLSVSAALTLTCSAAAPMRVAFEENRTVYLSVETVGSMSPVSVSYGSNFSAGAYYYYSQLDVDQKAVFDKLKTLTPTSGEIRIPLPTQITYTSVSSKPTDAEMQPAGNEVGRIVQGALDALLKDYPEIFWLDIGGSKIGWSSSGKSINGHYQFTITEISFVPACIASYDSIKSTIVSKMNTAIGSFPVTGDTRYKKVKSIHDGLSRRIAYDYDEAHDRRFDAYGALIDGLSVCEGYAESFKLICDREGIPCILVVGMGVTSSGSEGHMWNAVQMDDGKWYGVDVTWDDQTEKYNFISTDFLLVGSSTKDQSFGKKAFSVSHEASGLFTNVSYSIEFKYPALSVSAFVPGSGVTTSASTVPTGIVPPVQSGTTSAPVISTTAATTAGTKATTKKAAGNTSTTAKKTNTTPVGTQTVATSIDTTVYEDASLLNTDNTGDSTDISSATDGKNAPLWNAVPLIVGGMVVLAAVVLVLVLLLRRAQKRHTPEE